MTISAEIAREGDNELSSNFAAPPPVVDIDTTTRAGGGAATGGSTSSTSSTSGDGGAAQVSPVDKRTTERKNLVGGEGSGAQVNQDVFPTRNGVGPGGPAMGFDDAYRFLNTPTSLGQVQGQIGAGQRQGEAMAEEFRQGAGGDIGFGQEERDVLGGALAAGAGEEQYAEARDVLFRKYGGPRALGQKEEGEEGVSDWEKTRRLLGQSQIAAEAMGTGEGRSALFELQGLSPGMAAAETKRRHDQPGYAKEAQQTGALGGELYAGLGQQLTDTAKLGQERVEQASAAGSEARTAFSDVGVRILDEAGKRADVTNEQMKSAQKAFADFIESGDMKDLAGHINTAIFDGHLPVHDAMTTWNGIYTKPEYASIADYAPLQVEVHYTGTPMYVLSDKDKRTWEHDVRFDKLGPIFDQMRAEASGHDPGKWMDILMGYATEGQRQLSDPETGDPGGINAWPELTDVEKENFRLANPRMERLREVELTMEEAEELYLAQHTAATNRAEADTPRGRLPQGRGDQAIVMLQELQKMVSRNEELAVDFGMAMPETMGWRGEGGIRSGGDFNVGGTPYIGGENAGDARYRGQHFIAPPAEGQERGQYSHIKNIFGDAPGTKGAVNIRDMNEGFIVQPEGVATWQQSLTKDDARRYNTIQTLLDQQDVALEAGQPLDPQIQVNLEKLLTQTQKWTDSADEEMSENEKAWTDFLKEARDRFTRGVAKADSGWPWDNPSSRFKVRPVYGEGGVREAPDEGDWEIL